MGHQDLAVSASSGAGIRMTRPARGAAHLCALTRSRGDFSRKGEAHGRGLLSGCYTCVGKLFTLTALRFACQVWVMPGLSDGEASE